MRRLHWYPLLMLLLVARPSSALQLRWSSGASDLSFAAATRCTLVVQADPEEGSLPPQWRLLYVVENCDLCPVPIAPETGCQQSVAEVTSVDMPTDP